MKVIVVSHGGFSKGLVESVQMLVGEQEDLVAYGLYPEQTVQSLTEELEKELKNTPEGEEVLFLTDLFHGSPFNAVVSLMRDYKFHHVTGINLPLAITIMLERSCTDSVAELCEKVEKMAAETVMYVDKLFEEKEEEE